jgi:multidrug efflux pump subunit AcrA (membrane-fusion protein)
MKKKLLLFLGKIKALTFSTKKRKIITLILIFVLGISGWFTFKNQAPKITYQTATVEKGTLTTSISSTGTITSANTIDISTKVSGTVNKVYVTNGDAVTKGQEIAEVTLDDYAQERQAAAWVAYLSAVEAVKSAQTSKDTNDLTMWEDRQSLLDAQEEMDRVNNNLLNPDTNKIYTTNEQMIVTKTLAEAKKKLADDEVKYTNSDASIANAQAKVAAALRDYQANSSTIVAPSDGIVSNLVLAEGVAIAASSSTSNTTGSTIISAQTVGKINDPEGQLIATVNLTESDIVSVKANQKVNLTLDAYSDKTFTGKVLSINTSGSVSSGVTTYPVTIILDKTDTIIYLNMAVSATIITNIKANVLLIDSGTLDTENDKTVVHVLKNGKASSVEVTTGDSDDSQTEITRGLSEGDSVITNYISASNPSENNTTSAFGSTSRSGNSSNTRGSGGTMMFGGPGM